jgi:hypothetical protein
VLLLCDAEHLLEAYEKRCVEALADLSLTERRASYLTSPSMLTPTEGFEAALALNDLLNKTRVHSR